MANSPQSIKRVRQSNARRERLRGQRSRVRTVVKKTIEKIAGGELKDIQQLQKTLDTAARKRLIAPNRAQRLKSRLNARIVAASATKK